MATRIQGHGHSLMCHINAHFHVDQTPPVPAPQCPGRLSKTGTRCRLRPIAPEMPHAGWGVISEKPGRSGGARGDEPSVRGRSG